MLNEGHRDDAFISRETAAAMRDFAGTVTQVPPLRLAAGTAPARSRSRAGVLGRGHWRPWLTPLAAAVTVGAVAAALVVVKDMPHGGAATLGHGAVPATGTSASASASPGQSSPADCANSKDRLCRIEAATDDPAPLTVAELFRPAFAYQATTDPAATYTRVATRADASCAAAVLGTEIASFLQRHPCLQALRGSYVSSAGIMGTVAVLNLPTASDAKLAAGQSSADFAGGLQSGAAVSQLDGPIVVPLASKTGPAASLGTGTGTVEVSYRGHYLIMTFAQYANGAAPSTAAQRSALQGFTNELVAGTANFALSQRMLTGKPRAVSGS